MTFAGTHMHSPVNYGGDDYLDAWNVSLKAFIPISITNRGELTPYYIEVNNSPVSAVFTMSDRETLDVEVPVVLSNRHGPQEFNVCSIALHGDVGSRICTKAELFFIKQD